MAPHRATATPAPAFRRGRNADPELVKLFIEEAHEELAKIKKFFPAWDQNPMEREALVTVRRSFHTLKGSGRMVGARELGEFAWSIENLLNRVLDNTLTRSPGRLSKCCATPSTALPDMIEQLETGRAPRVDPRAIAARANALAAGKPLPVPGAGAMTRTQVILPTVGAAGAVAAEKTQVISPPAARGHRDVSRLPTLCRRRGAELVRGHPRRRSAVTTAAPLGGHRWRRVFDSTGRSRPRHTGRSTRRHSAPKAPTFAQSVTAPDFAHPQTIVVVHPPHSLSDDTVAPARTSTAGAISRRRRRLKPSAPTPVTTSTPLAGSDLGCSTRTSTTSRRKWPRAGDNLEPQAGTPDRTADSRATAAPGASSFFGFPDEPAKPKSRSSSGRPASSSSDDNVERDAGSVSVGRAGPRCLRRLPHLHHFSNTFSAHRRVADALMLSEDESESCQIRAHGRRLAAAQQPRSGCSSEELIDAGGARVMEEESLRRR